MRQSSAVYKGTSLLIRRKQLFDESFSLGSIVEYPADARVALMRNRENRVTGALYDLQRSVL